MRKFEGAVRWTPYMDDCISVLWEMREAPLDSSLVIQVKLQLIAEEAIKVSRSVGEATDQHRMLQHMQIKLLRNRLSEVKAMIPPELMNDSKFVP